MPNLRFYQREALGEFLEAYSSRKNTLIVGPCGSGKTDLFAAIARRVEDEGIILFVTPRTVLTDQTAARLRSYGLDAGVFDPKDPMGNSIQVATIQMILEHLDEIGNLNLVMLAFDEAHHYEAEEWSKLRSRHPKIFRLGLTATPVRGDGRGLGPWFDVVVQNGTYSELIQAGYLVPARVYAPACKVPVNGLAMKPCDAFQMYAEQASKRTLIVCSSIKEAEEQYRTFMSAGASASILHSKLSQSENDSALGYFRHGQISVLISVMMLNEGLDVPEAECLILMRRFEHLGFYIQTAGRVLRPSPGKRDGTIIDLVGASLVHGPPDTDRAWDLSDNPKQGRVDPVRGDVVSSPNYEKSVTGEQLYRLYHGALSPTDPDPQPFDLPHRRATVVIRSHNEWVRRHARRLGRYKGQSARDTYLREMSARYGAFDVSL